MKTLTGILVLTLLSIALAARGFAAEAIPPGPAARAPQVAPVERLGSPASKVAKNLVKLLDDSPCWEMRLWLTDNLGKLGPDAAEAVPALTGLLTDRESAIQQSAADALGRIGLAADSAVLPLTALLTNQTPNVRNVATASLIQIEEAVARHAAERDRVRDFAAAAQVVSEVVSKVTPLLDHPYWCVRRNAADVLGGVGTRAHKDALLALKKTPAADKETWLFNHDPVAMALRNRIQSDNDPAVRIAAATALASGFQGEYMDVPVPYVAKLLHDPHDVRKSAELTRYQCACVAEPVCDPHDAGVRALAAELLGRIGLAAQKALNDRPTDKAIQDVAQGLTDVQQALNALAGGQVLADAEPALKDVEQTLKDAEAVNDPVVENALIDAEQALIDAEKALTDPAAKQALEGANPALIKAKTALESAKQALIEAKPALIKAATPALKEAKKALVDGLQDCEYRVRIAAVQALGEMGSDAGDDETYSAIAKLLRDDVDDVRLEALKAMMQINEKGK